MSKLHRYIDCDHREQHEDSAKQDNRIGEDATATPKGSKWIWEPEEEMREHYYELFAATDIEDEF